MSKEFEEELFLPCGEFHFVRDRAFIWVGSQDVEGHASEDGEILRRVIFAGSGVVFVEDDVERPVKIVFDAPIGSDRRHHLFGRQAFGERDIVGEALDFTIGEPTFAFDAAQMRQAGEVRQADDLVVLSLLEGLQARAEPRTAEVLRARFDRIFKRGRTGYATLDSLLKRLHRHKDELLRVLERPEIPLNTNASENDIRAFVTKRKISGGTVSDKGRDARDVMLGLAKTCMKLKLSFYAFIGDRLGIPGPKIPDLATLVRPAPA